MSGFVKAHDPGKECLDAQHRQSPLGDVPGIVGHQHQPAIPGKLLQRRAQTRIVAQVVLGPDGPAPKFHAFRDGVAQATQQGVAETGLPVGMAVSVVGFPGGQLGVELPHGKAQVGGQEDDLIADLGSVVLFMPVQSEVHVKNEATDEGRQGVGDHEC